MLKLVTYWIVITTLFLSLIFAASRKTITTDESCMARLEKGNWITKLNISTRQPQKIYKSDKYWVHSLTVSPDNKYIAFIEETQPKYTRNGYEVAPHYSLAVINTEGKLISRVEQDVKKYVWNPQGDKIAFLTFAPKDPDYEFKYPTGVWIFDISTLKKKKIAEKGIEINWANFDKNIYFLDRKKVFRWNPNTEQLDSTKFQDIYFSPDGKYYLRLWKDEGKPIQLFETSSNKEIFTIKAYKKLLPAGDTTESFPKNIGDLWSSHDLDTPHSWVFNQGHYLLFTKAEVIIETKGEGPVKAIKSREVKDIRNFIYDPEQRRVIKEFEGSISSWIGDGSRIILEHKGEIIFEEIK